VTLIPGAVGVCKHKGECEHRVEHRAEHDIEQSGTGPSVFANTKVSANIACKGKEASTLLFKPHAPLVMKLVIPLTCKWHMRVQMHDVHKCIAVNKQEWALVAASEETSDTHTDPRSSPT
jgi:hypothetical protein